MRACLVVVFFFLFFFFFLAVFGSVTILTFRLTRIFIKRQQRRKKQLVSQLVSQLLKGWMGQQQLMTERPETGACSYSMWPAIITKNKFLRRFYFFSNRLKEIAGMNPESIDILKRRKCKKCISSETNVCPCGSQDSC